MPLATLTGFNSRKKSDILNIEFKLITWENIMSTDDKRLDTRLPVLWTGTLTTEDDTEYPCEVRDISLAGTLISTSANIPMGERILLEIKGLGEFAAEVKWQGSAQLGLLILAGPDLVLKKFAEGAGASVSDEPKATGSDPLAIT
tara:strand:+ start:270 stop:704 length:435 start_codon:yes stop_codon:yes gene_type:complete